MKTDRYVSAFLASLLAVGLSQGRVAGQATVQSTLELARALAQELAAGLAPPAGDVVDVDGADVFLNVGSQAGVKTGMEFTIVRPGREVVDPSTGQSLGAISVEVARVRVHHVQERFSVARVTSGAGRVEVGMRATANVSKPRVAVLEVAVTESQQDLGRVLPDLLVSELARSRSMELIERNQIRRALEELGFGASGLVTRESAKRLGQLLGADYLVLGSAADVDEGQLVSLRALAVEDGTVRTAATALLRNRGAYFEGLPPGVTINNLKLWPVLDEWSQRLGRSDLGNYTYGYWLPITGELRNASSETYVALVFDVTVYDRQGHLLATDRLSLGALRAGESRPFRIHVYLGSYRPPAEPSRVQFVTRGDQRV